MTSYVRAVVFVWWWWWWWYIDVRKLKIECFGDVNIKYCLVDVGGGGVRLKFEVWPVFVLSSIACGSAVDPCGALWWWW